MKAISLLERLGVTYTLLTEEQIDEHKRAWLHQFIPPEKQQKAVESYCYSDYLWHAFSYKLLECLTGDEARIALSGVQDNKAILLSNLDDSGAPIPAGFQIPEASLLTASSLDEIDDIVLTSVDFKWTYAKAHEPGLGPYFFYFDL